MKQHKIKPMGTKPVTQDTPHQAQTKQEFDAGLKKVAQVIEKDPKKAAKIFESWLKKPASTKVIKKAA